MTLRQQVRPEVVSPCSPPSPCPWRDRGCPSGHEWHQVSLLVPAPSHPPRPHHLRRVTESSSISFFFNINNRLGRQAWPPRQQLIRDSARPVLAGGSVVGGAGEGLGGMLPWRVSLPREDSPLDGEPLLRSILCVPLHKNLNSTKVMRRSVIPLIPGASSRPWFSAHTQ